MNLKSIILAAIILIFAQIAVMAQADPSSSFSASSSATCLAGGDISVMVLANINWTMTVYREYAITGGAGGNYTSGAASGSNVGWTNGTHALDGSNRWSEWDKLWIGTNSSGVFATQHFIEFDCTGKAPGDPADVHICNTFIGNDPYLCPQAGGGSGSGNPDEVFHFRDGRLNSYDVSTPIVVYPWENETGLGLAIYSDEGNALLFVSAADLGECPDENTLIAANESAQVWVYRLSSCEYQINATQYNGKTYVLRFAEIGSAVGYSSYEID